MLFLEGIPAVFLGVMCLMYLTEKPEQAKWLKPEEKQWLLGELAKDAAQKPHVKKLTTLQAMVEPTVLYLSAIYFVYQCGSLGIGYWLPQIIKGFSNTLTATQIGFIATVPYIVATIVMIVWSRSSDKRNERKIHTFIPLFWASLALFSLYFISNGFMAIAMISFLWQGCMRLNHHFGQYRPCF